jgi:hypothetical protein
VSFILALILSHLISPPNVPYSAASVLWSHRFNPIQVAHSSSDATEEILGVLNMGYPYSGRAEDGLITDEGKEGKIHQFMYVFVQCLVLGGNK